MEIILKENFPQLGFVGDKVAVRNGYARNFLIPKGLAIEINKRNEKFVKNQIQAIEARKVKMKQEAQELGDKLCADTFVFKLKVGKKGKTFGSLSAKAIYDEVIAKGYVIDRKQIILSEPVKFVGDFTFKAKLHSELTINVPMKVVAEDLTKEEEQAIAEKEQEEAPIVLEEEKKE